MRVRVCVRASVCIHVNARVGARPDTRVPASRWRKPLGPEAGIWPEERAVRDRGVPGDGRL